MVSNSGYADEQRRKIKDNGIVDKLAELQRQLAKSGYTVSEPDLSFSQDPTIWITGFSTVVRVQVKMQLTGEKVVLNFRAECTNPHSPSKDKREQLEQAVQGKGFQSRNKGAYAPLADFTTKDGYPGGIPREDLPTIHDLLASGIAKLKG